MVRLYKGERWGTLECTGLVYEESEHDAFSGHQKRPKAFYRLVCDCGQVVKIPTHEFRGKRVIRDCGNGCADQHRYIDVRYRVSVQTVDIIVSHARKQKITAARAFEDLIQRGWADLVSNEQSETTAETT